MYKAFLDHIFSLRLREPAGVQLNFFMKKTTYCFFKYTLKNLLIFFWVKNKTNILHAQKSKSRKI